MDSVSKYFENEREGYETRSMYPGDIEITVNKNVPSNEGTVPPTDTNFIKTDKYIQAVKEKFEQRSQTGIKKYGTTLEREDLNELDWLTHLEEELMDALGYIQVLRDKLQNREHPSTQR